MFKSYIIESYYAFNGLIKKIINAQPNLTAEQKTALRAELKSLNNKDLVSYYNSIVGITNTSNVNNETNNDEKEGEGSE